MACNECRGWSVRFLHMTTASTLDRPASAAEDEGCPVRPGARPRHCARTDNLADLADEFDVESFVMISTDKAVNPDERDGLLQAAGRAVRAGPAAGSQCRFVTVRFGNVLDSAGSVVPIFREQIARGGPVTVTHPDMVRYFMMIPEAAQLVIQAGAMGQGGEIFVLDMGEPVRIVDLAHDMIRLPACASATTSKSNSSACGPARSCTKSCTTTAKLRQPTPHPKIMVAESHRLELAAVRGRLIALAQACDSDPRDALRMIQQVLADSARSTALPAATPMKRAA